MSKAKNGTTGSTALALQGHEQSTLRVLLAQREQANASLAAASGSVRNYLIQLLQGRGLDPQKWGVSPDMTAFVEIQQPPAPDPNAAAAPAPGAPAAFVPPTAPAQAPAAAAPAAS